MKFDKLRNNSNKIINVEKKKYEKWCSMYQKRKIIVITSLFLMLLIGALGFHFGRTTCESKIEQVFVTVEKEVCPKFTTGSATIITGDTMEETVIILVGK